MLIFATSVSFAVSIFDYLEMRKQAVEHNRHQIRQTELIAVQALETVEKAYAQFGSHIAEQMKDSTLYLLDLYDRNPDFSTWDFAALRRELSADIYIIDERNVIIHSSFEADIGLDFTACCATLSDILDQRRESGEFFHDGIDIEQKTGKLKKYSYMATRDKRYLIQLGYDLSEDEIFRQFNFWDVFERFAQFSPSVHAIRVIHSGGYVLSENGNPAETLEPERKPYFERALTTGETTEYEGVWNGQPATYRYVQYVSDYDLGATRNKVLEIVYDDTDLQGMLNENKNRLLVQLSLISLSAVAISFIITRWVAKPLHLAFHDPLTGLKNRAALDELFQKTAEKSKGRMAVLMIDLDDFKRVNDEYGHDRGDEVLRSVAQRLRRIARKQDFAFRHGGDEFVLVMPSAGAEEARQTAEAFLRSLEDIVLPETAPEPALSASIGIALFPEHGQHPSSLLKKADAALYMAKGKGKNRYHVFE